MAGKFSRDKGQRAEREVIKILQPVVDEVYEEAGMTPPVLQRNLMQSHLGGCDLDGLDWIAVEVKHQETLAVEKWWAQAKAQSKAKTDQVRLKSGRKINCEPVLLFRQSRSVWRVLVLVEVRVSLKSRLKCRVEMPIKTFLVYFRERLKSELRGCKD